MAPEEAAKDVADFLLYSVEDLSMWVQFSEKSGGFKIWTSSIEIPGNVKDVLPLCTSSRSSTFKGSERKVRTRFLDKALLEDSVVELLKEMCDKMVDWTVLAYDKFIAKRAEMCKKAYYQIK